MPDFDLIAFECVEHIRYSTLTSDTLEARKRIAAALHAARREALEEARRIVWRHACANAMHHGNGSAGCPRELHHHHDAMCNLGDVITAKIRALIAADDAKLRAAGWVKP